MTNPKVPEADYYSMSELLTKFSYRHSSSIYDRIEAHGFPEPLYVGRTPRWPRDEVEIWVASRPRGRRNKPPRAAVLVAMAILSALAIGNRADARVATRQSSAPSSP